MKKLSFILALIIALTGMIGLFATTAYAAGDGTQANPITVGGEGADYATVGAALAAIGATEDTTYIKVTGNTTETTAEITVASDVVIYSDATGDARPTIAFAEGVTVANTSYYYWIMVDGAALTFDGVQISTTNLNNSLNGTLNGGPIVLKNGAKLSVLNSAVDNDGPNTKNGGFVFFNDNAHYGDVVIDNSTIISTNRGIQFAKSTKSSSVTIKNGSVLESKSNHAIQASITTQDTLAIKIYDSTVKAGSGKQIMYNRALKAVVEMVNANVTAGTLIIDARNDKADLIATVIGGTYSGTELVKLKSVNADIKIVNADLTGITSAIVNNEGKSAGVAVNTYGVTYGACEVFTDVVPTALTDAEAALVVDGWYYDEATNTYTVATADGLIAVSAAIKAKDVAEGTNGAGSATNKEDATIVFVADIDMNDATGTWDPICNYSNGVFVGTIDGQGHTIYNFTDINATQNRRGLIARAGACTVKNLTFVDAVVTGKDNTAVIVGDIFGGVAGETTTIENCKVINATVKGGSYTGSLIGKGTKELNVVIKNCVVDGSVSGGSHVGFIMGGEAATVNTVVYTFEDIVASGTVAGGTNAGLTGYFCDINVNLKNILSCVEATATNASSVMSNAKRCAVTMTNIVCINSPVASADALGEKVANDFVINNVFVIGTDAVNVFKAYAVNGTNSATLTVDGVAADFATATIGGVACANANAKVAEIFADNADLKAAAEEMVGPMINHVIPDDALSYDETKHWYNCVVCSEAVDTPHTFDKKVTEDAHVSVPATCTSYGEYFYSCECGYNGTETFVSTIILGHSMTQEVAEDKYLATAATCTAPATYYKSCVCGLKGPDTFVYGDVLPHTFVEVVDEAYLNTPATCTAKATYFKTCACGAVSEETFEAGELVAHVFDQQVVADEYLEIGATCITPAEYYYSCVCGLKGEEIFTVEGFVDHVYGDWYVAVEPSINAEGKMEKACTVCGDKQSEPIPSTINSVKDTVLGTAGSVKDKVAGTLGCGGSIGGTSIIIMIAAAGAVIARKKKED